MESKIQTVLATAAASGKRIDCYALANNYGNTLEQVQGQTCEHNQQWVERLSKSPYHCTVLNDISDPEFEWKCSKVMSSLFGCTSQGALSYTSVIRQDGTLQAFCDKDTSCVQQALQTAIALASSSNPPSTTPPPTPPPPSTPPTLRPTLPPSTSGAVPTSAPTAPTAGQLITLPFTVTLTGITLQQFNNAAQDGFKTAVAIGAGALCTVLPSTRSDFNVLSVGLEQEELRSSAQYALCSADHVCCMSSSSARRGAVAVSAELKVADAEALQLAAARLAVYFADNSMAGFLAQLQGQGGTLALVTAVNADVVSGPSNAQADEEATASEAGGLSGAAVAVIVVGVVLVALGWLMFGAWYYWRSTHRGKEDNWAELDEVGMEDASQGGAARNQPTSMPHRNGGKSLADRWAMRSSDA